MLVLLLTVNPAAVPLKVTLEAPRKFLPLMVTSVPPPPAAGLKLVMLAG